MPAAYRVTQTTGTTGTGPLALNAPAADARGFLAALGGPRAVRYGISWAGGYEIGHGRFDGNSPGGLTRSAVLYSSAANGFVSLPPGAKDVWLEADALEPDVVPLAGAATATLAQLGNLLRHTGAAAGTIGLPAAAQVPVGAGYRVQNAGQHLLVVDPAGGETVNGATSLPLAPGEGAELLCLGTEWAALGVRRGWVQIAATPIAAAVAAVDFGLPAGFSRFRLELDNVALPLAMLGLRTSVSGAAGVSFGLSDYWRAVGERTPDTGQEILVTAQASTRVWATLEVLPGDPSAPAAVTGVSGAVASIINHPPAVVHGHRSTAGRINLVRLFPLSGSLSSGGVVLHGRRD